MNERDRLMLNEYNKYKHLPPDLFPRRLNVGEPTERMTPSQAAALSPTVEGVRDYPTAGFGEGLILTRNLVGRAFTVGTAPTLLISSPYQWPYLVLNPSTTIGLTTTVTGFSGAVVNGTTSPSIGVSGVNQVHLILDVTAIVAANTWDIYLQAFDGISGTWVDTQAVFVGVAATGQIYAFPNSFGIGTDMRFRFAQTAGVGGMTCSIGVIMKEGLGGSLAGLSQALYLGGPNVTTTSGFPLLEGVSKTFVISEGVELWGVASTNINVRIFQL